MKAARGALFLLAASCASSGGGAGGGSVMPAAPAHHELPTREEVTSIAESPAPARPIEGSRVDLATWDFAAGAPDRIGDVPLSSPTRVDAMLQKAVQGGDVRLTEGMRCVATELARIRLAHGERPAPRLEEFVLGRCGTPVRSVATNLLVGDVDAKHPDAELFDHWGDQLQKMLATANRGGPMLAGAALVRDEKRAMFFLAAAPRVVDVAPVSMFPGADGAVVLEGAVQAPASSLQAIASQGKAGTASCARDESVALPRFRVSCPVDKSDATAWISVFAFQQGRLLGEEVLSVLALPQGQAVPRFEKVAYAPPTPRPARDADVGPALLQLVNDVRAQRGQRPLTLATGQSKTAARLAPHFFAATYSERGDPQLADRVALGLMAGWDVDGLIRDGSFGFAAAFETDDLAELLGSALEHPNTRRVLLGDAYDAVAFGPLRVPEARMNGVLIGTYDLFEKIEPTADAKRVFDALAAARGKRGAMPPGLLAEAVDAKAADASAAIARGDDPSDALHVFLKASVDTMRTGLRGWTIQTRSLDDIEWPDELLAAGQVNVSVAIGTTRPRGAAWGNYAVLVVAKTADKVDVAAHGARFAG